MYEFSSLIVEICPASHSPSWYDHTRSPTLKEDQGMLDVLDRNRTNKKPEQFPSRETICPLGLNNILRTDFVSLLVPSRKLESNHKIGGSGGFLFDPFPFPSVLSTVGRNRFPVLPSRKKRSGRKLLHFFPAKTTGLLCMHSSQREKIFEINKTVFEAFDLSETSAARRLCELKIKK